MIQPNELRIGNYIACHYTSLERQVNVDDFRLIDGYIRAYEYFQPIPLTEEWLLKLGWVWNEECNSYEKYPNGDARMHLYESILGSYTMFNYVIGATIAERLNYVHQLQNLYFALTGEELMVKELA